MYFLNRKKHLSLGLVRRWYFRDNAYWTGMVLSKYFLFMNGCNVYLHFINAFLHLSHGLLGLKISKKGILKSNYVVLIRKIC